MEVRRKITQFPFENQKTTTKNDGESMSYATKLVSYVLQGSLDKTSYDSLTHTLTLKTQFYKRNVKITLLKLKHGILKNVRLFLLKNACSFADFDTCFVSCIFSEIEKIRIFLH